MPNTMKNQLTNVIFNVMAEMYFIFPLEVDGDEKAISPETTCYRLTYKGESDFFLEISIENSLLSMMIQNFIGIDANDLDPNTIAEGGKEFVNIVGGNFMDCFDHPCSMGIPEIITPNNAIQLSQSLEKGRLNFENGMLEVALVYQ